MKSICGRRNWLESTLAVASILPRYSAFKTNESGIKPMRVCKGRYGR
jgi:hypothetical protein